MITRPVRERSITGIGEMVEPPGSQPPATRRSACSASPRPTTPRSARSRRAWPTATRAPRPRSRCRPPGSTRSTSTSRPSSAAAGGAPGSRSPRKAARSGCARSSTRPSPRDDLIKTVTTAYAAGWSQVKLYFMCGLPTETDEDVLQIAELAKSVIKAGREATGRRDIRCTVSIGGFVPKPHTPVPVGGAALGRGDRPAAAAAARRDRPGPLDRLPLPRRPARHRRRPALARRPAGRAPSSPRWCGAAAASTVGASTSRSTAGWRRPRPSASTSTGTPRASAPAPRCCPGTTSTSGLDEEWLWSDWQEALDEREIDDCRWSPCFDCGVCPTMGTQIETGPTGRTLLPLHRRHERPLSIQKRQPDLAGRPDRGRAAYPAALRQAGTPAVHLPPRSQPRVRAGDPAGRACRWRTRPGSRLTRRISWVGAAPTGAASEAEYVEIGLAQRASIRQGCCVTWTRRCPPGVDVLDAVIALPGGGKLAERIDASRWELRITGTDGATLRPAVEALLAATSAPVERYEGG